MIAVYLNQCILLGDHLGEIKKNTLLYQPFSTIIILYYHIKD